MRVPVDRLLAIYEAVARHHGADDDEAALFAGCLIRADLRGHPTQGIGLLPYLSELLAAGSMAFGRPLTIVSETPAITVLDGHNGAGHVVGTRAMDIAIEKARTLGIGFVTVRRGGDYGMASNYALQAVDQGMIGLSMSTGPLLVAPWGGRDARFCTNPIAVAVPAGEREPVVIDMATSASSMGKVVLAARDGRRLDGPEVVDAQGCYTDDPARVILNVMDRESRMAGALLPAGPKGFSMVLMVEMLSALLSGERTWQDERPAGPDGREAFYSHTFVAISVAHFQPPEAFAASADRMIETLTGSRPAEGFAKVRLPGEGAAARERDYRERGVEVREEEWAMVESLAARLGLSTQVAAP